ncbi:unnamed protein product [Spirodela intermedia]|uniref:Uncharacterized protein n=2 Tax=Spirodela intermedia TaxID=51605 RepID=A0A7I8LCE3_SPIIN|nr:unnamed protein product [Spirodela intermedia]CAA6669962.1 unnamed protein product [Spirodela intermedia]CAA7406945.1 unnamed protein product [Spirodela intermedia]
MTHPLVKAFQHVIYLLSHLKSLGFTRKKQNALNCKLLFFGRSVDAAMLRRKPSKIEVKAEDRDELEDAIRARHCTPASSAAASATSLLQSLLVKKPTLQPAEKAQIIGISQGP